MVMIFFLMATIYIYPFCILKSTYKKSMQSDLVRMPLSAFWTGVSGLVLLIVAFVKTNPLPRIEKEDINILAFVYCMCICLLFLSILQINWEIQFSKEKSYFLYTSMFGRKTEIPYSEIEKIHRYKGGIVFKYHHKRYFIDFDADRVEDFLVLFNYKTPKSSWR